MGSSTTTPPNTSSSSFTPIINHLHTTIPSDNSRHELTHSLIPSLLQSIAEISSALRDAHHIKAAGTANSFGDDQLNVDITAETSIRLALSRCPSVATASSEEDPIQRPVSHPDCSSSSSSEVYTVAFDPLDGSSIIAPNWTVGTIIGIWDSPSALSCSPAEKQIASILGVYGPRTTAIIAVRFPFSSPLCFEVSLDTNSHTWAVTWPSFEYNSPPPKTRYFSPANLRSASSLPQYSSLISQYISEEYTLRYSGGMVPDVVHSLVKRHGIYLSPVTDTHKAKLRRLYELCPIALVVECAGGKAVDLDGNDILATEVLNEDERGGIVCGTREEVGKAMKVLLG
ncbi:hypothetical protein QBC35DRAFT_211054 [Podospora australis]|uniref:Sedoheptulose-1,7-bisphosphatase n=1 Tax=Podospora australis TaxID=1536484 RepID=A0AAN7AIQ2_9PEZI|nr:hypothetical protein QBC35DRAFT_211054 [Podospora australis]